jgi:hypothetical protein
MRLRFGFVIRPLYTLSERHPKPVQEVANKNTHMSLSYRISRSRRSRKRRSLSFVTSGKARS